MTQPTPLGERIGVVLLIEPVFGAETGCCFRGRLLIFVWRWADTSVRLTATPDGGLRAKRFRQCWFAAKIRPGGDLRLGLWFRLWRSFGLLRAFIWFLLDDLLRHLFSGQRFRRRISGRRLLSFFLWHMDGLRICDTLDHCLCFLILGLHFVCILILLHELPITSLPFSQNLLSLSIRRFLGPLNQVSNFLCFLQQKI